MTSISTRYVTADFVNIEFKSLPTNGRPAEVLRRAEVAASLANTWLDMGLTKEQIAFGIQTVNVESQFKSTVLAGTTTAFGLGQFTNGTWKDAVTGYNQKYGTSIDYLSNEQKVNVGIQTLVLGFWIQKDIKGAENILLNNSSYSGFTLYEIAYGLHHHGQYSATSTNPQNNLLTYLTNGYEDTNGNPEYFSAEGSAAKNQPKYYIDKTFEISAFNLTKLGATASTNSNIFNLDTDPSTLKPMGSLGSTSSGWGLLGSGAGFSFSMTSPYVNNNGGAYVSSSCITANGVRVGNGSINECSGLMDQSRLFFTFSDLSSNSLFAGGSMSLGGQYKSLAYTDPVTLDSNNDGVRFSATPVNFDYDADGAPESLTWTAPTDPLLVLDLNSDGRINNGTELVDLTNSGNPLNLFTLDSQAEGGNADGKLDSQDDVYWNLQIWTDTNQDGYASARELQTLADVGIQSIDVNPAHMLTQTVAGQANVKGVTATYSNGSTRPLWDVPFQATNTSSNPVTTITYAPNVNKVTSTINGNAQSALQAISSQGVNLTLNGSGASQAIGSLGNDTLTGTVGDDWLIGGAGADKFQGGDGSDLLVIDAEDIAADIDAGSGIDTLLVADDRGVFLNLSQSHVEVIYGGYGDDVFIGGGADNYFIAAAAGDDLIVGGTADDVLSGEDGDDIIQGGKGDDLIRGHRHADQLFGGEGNDVLDGGLDNDKLYGETGNDVFIESRGNDTIDGGEGIDLIELSGGLEDYHFVKNTDGSYTVSNINADHLGSSHLVNVERFSFMRGQVPAVVDFGMAAPLPVNDQQTVTAGAASYTIAVSSLVANDVDFQSAGSALSIYWVGDALGGSVVLSADKKNVIFTPTQSFNGTFEFAYKVKDPQGNLSPEVVSTADATLRGELKGRVLLVPNDGPADPEYSKQWYLGAIGATQAWKDGYTGKGVKVLVLEPSGEFAVSSQAADLNSADLIANKSDGFDDTQYHSVHATQVAGVIAASRNGIGSVGIAHQATLNSMGFLKVSSIPIYKAFLDEMQNYDVVNNSWGHLDPWDSNSNSGWTLTRDISKVAIKNAASYGRDGLGTIMVYAAGNDRTKGYDSGLSSLTDNGYTINVGAINLLGDIGSGISNSKPFSSRGANILISAPGSNIVTTGVEVTTANGTTIGSDITETQGTSFATPIISGVAALMLEANPNLTYRDVQTILSMTAKKSFGAGTQAETTWYNNHENDWNGTGMHYSHDFGFGMVDAAAAVNMAETWISDRNDLKQVLSGSSSADTLADLGQQVLNFNVADNIDIEHVILNLDLHHARWSDLVVTLVSPTGTRSILLDRTGVQNGQIYLSNPAGETHFGNQLMSVHFRGESSVGNWQLIVEDKSAGFAGSNIYASLEIMGSDSETIKRYFLTDEYAGGWNLQPALDKPTELNASAMSYAAKVDLSGITTSLINGKAFTVSAGIDRLIAGSGNDTLIGGSGNETILGGQGNDSITGGSGSDSLVGGQGNDSLNGGAGRDVMVGGLGQDSLWGGADSDVFVIDGNALGTTYIKDFNAASNGDFLRIRSDQPLAWNAITQTILQGNLQLTFAVEGGTHKVVLEGLNVLLNSNQLKIIGANEDVAVDATGSFTERNVIRVAPVASIKETVYEVNSSYTGHSRTVEYSIESITWTPGTNADDLMIAGAAIRPWQISEANWQNAMQYQYRYFGGLGGNDEIVGDSSAERMDGGSGSDTLNGGGGDDTLSGGSDADQFNFSSGHGSDVITDLESVDVLNFTSIQSISGTTTYSSASINQFTAKTILVNGADSIAFDRLINFSQLASANVALYNINGSLNQTYTLTGTTITQNSDLIMQGATKYVSKNINTLGGDDVIYALDSNALNIDGGLGSDTIYALGGNDTINGGEGDDHIQITSSSASTLLDTVNAGAGNDTISSSNVSLIYGDAGNDIITTGNGNDTLYGGGDNDALNSGAGNDSLIGEAGNDSLIGGDGNDDLLGGAGLDSLVGGDGIDTLDGGEDKDYLFGGNNNDFIYGRAGEDQLVGGYGNDWLEGGDDNDQLSAGDGDDTLLGGSGNDALSGDIGNDHLYGDIGDDVLNGGDGDDALYGGAGNDYITTGSGIDTIYVNTTSGNDTASGLTGLDTINFQGLTKSSVQFSLLDNGARVKITWGVHSIILQEYSVTTKLQFDGQSGLLKDLFVDGGYNPDGSFDFLASFDTQLPDDKTKVGTVIGSEVDEGLYGGPSTLTPAAYWYVLGRGGDDSLAGGLSGAILDGGEGNDRIRLSNGVTVVRDTLFGGVDTLQLPEGITPEMLVFSRVVNPLEADNNFSSNGFTSVEQAALSKLELTPLERFLASHSLSPDASYQLKGLIELANGEAAHYNLDYYNNEYGEVRNGFRSNHFNTLRIQSKDGKFTADVVSYFDEGILKNNLDSLVFTTAFDNSGNSLKLNLEEMIQARPKDTLVDITTVLLSSNFNYSSLERGLGINGKEKAIVGGEGGTYIKGRQALVFHDASYYDVYQQSNVAISSSSSQIVDAGSSLRQIQYKAPNNSSITRTATVNSSAKVEVLAMSDILLGFGGNDTIWGGGAYYNYTSTDSENVNTRTNDVVNSGTVFLWMDWGRYVWHEQDYSARLYQPISGKRNISRPLVDKVNGGDGDDTYIYKRNDGNLAIISLDVPNSGASGLDTLDMSEYRRNEVIIGAVNAHGGFKITGVSTTQSTTPVNITIANGLNGDIQVDYIKIKDNITSQIITINVKDLMAGQQLPVFHSDDGRQYHDSIYAIQPNNFETNSTRFNLLNGLNSSHVQQGSPSRDRIFLFDNSVAIGHEAQDFYAVDVNKVKFSVIQFDKSDSIEIYDHDVGLETAGTRNLYGKSDAEWLESGVIPDDPMADYYNLSTGWLGSFAAFIDFDVDVGYLMPLSSHQDMYSIDNWLSSQDNNDLGNDMLVSWKTTNANGLEEKHQLIITGALNNWGNSNFGNIYYNYSFYDNSTLLLQPDGFGTMGNDYMLSTSVDDNNGQGSRITQNVFGRAGNDTIIGYAHDYQSNLVWNPVTQQIEYFGEVTFIGNYDAFYGGTGSDLLDSGAGDDKLYGGADNDTLIGGYGSDILDGGAGEDSMDGGFGDDVYIVDSFDTVIEGLNAGNDEVRAVFSLDLADFTNIENASLLGQVANLELIGNSDSNKLQGNGAGSTLKGLGGNDTYVITNQADVIVEASGEGVDSIETAFDVFQLTKNVENIRSLGLGLNLFGNSSDNIILGDSGNNVLDGSFGQDTLEGGSGNDAYVVDTNNDVIIESANHGYDIVWVKTSYTLNDSGSNDVEVMRSESAGGVQMTGNGLDNLIVGAAGDDTLSGGIGIDSLFGGLGDDIYFIDNPLDLITENGNEGNDTISFTYNNLSSTPVELILGTGILANIENITTTGSGLFNLTGEASSNKLIGNSSANTLTGNLGNDTLIGGAGNDTYVVGGFVGTAYDSWFAAGGNYLVYEDVIYEDDGGTGDIDTLKLSIVSAYPDAMEAHRESVRDNDDLVILFSTVNDNPWDEQGSNNMVYESVRIKNYFAGTQYQVEKIQYSNDVTINTADVSYAYYGSGEDDTMVILQGTTATFGKLGNDIIYGNSSNNSIYGEDGNDFLKGDLGNDYLYGGNGNNIIQGQEGIDKLYSDMGNSILDAGLGNDTLTSLLGNDLLIGGKGNDSIIAGGGYDVISFNRGDGQDTVNATNDTSLNTLSLGGGFAYNQLSLTKTGNSLILKMGATDQITFKDWYVAPANKSVVNLQVIAEAVAGFSQDSTDSAKAALNDKVENFNFSALVAAFDAAGATSNWTLSDTLIKNYITIGSNDMAIGGDLAYQYGRNSNLTGIGLIAAQSVINTSTLGQSAQTFSTTMPGQSEAIKLG